MSDDLYREIILDHYKNPRGHGVIEGADAQAEGLNPLCGDEVSIYVQFAEDGETIDEAYEKALAADPNHVRTWSYYGMWQAEQGNRLKAEDYLQKVKLICGTADCEEYRQLRAVIDGTASY